MLSFFLYFVMVLLARLKPLLFNSMAILLSLLGFFSLSIIDSINCINCIGVTSLVLETDETSKDFKGIIPFGVSIYYDLRILETVDG